jgi:hypothetical protein
MRKLAGAMGMLAVGILSGCQVPDNSNINNPFALAGSSNVKADSDAASMQFASIARLPKPGARPYHRALYDGDIEVDVVPNPEIDAITGRELGPLGRRRQSALPFARRAIMYNSIIRKHARLNGIDYELARAIIYTESSFRVNALGRHGEIGLMQVKPSTARGMGYRGTKNQLYIPETNIKYGMRYLKRAQDRSDGTTCGMILKYNAGLYAKRMNPISARYCQKVKRLMRQARGAAATG